VGVVLHVVTQMGRRANGQTADKAGDPPVRPSARPPVEDLTPDELRASGYLPFGVSLAIAAGLIALVTGTEPVVAWFANYASLLGM
jgi:hypothetical protein